MRVNKKFGQRSVPEKTKEVLKKYYLAFEGEKTEVDYFTGIIDNAADIGISALVEIIPILRSHRERSYSNPKKILLRVIDYIEESKNEIIEKDSLIDRILDFMICNSDIQGIGMSRLDMQTLLEEVVISDVTFKDLFSVISGICKSIEEKTALIFSHTDITSYINNQSIVYEEGFDKVCLIVDRDKRSFLKEQFDFVLATCQAKGYQFYVTNPCFEFWLLLHFEQSLTLNKEEMFKNDNFNNTKTFLGKSLSDILGGYNKSHLRFDYFKDRLNIAIKNETQFCEEISCLENKLGSNIGLLIKEMKITQ